MGVRGLTTFMESQGNFIKPYRLHDCMVVIDGNNLIHFLYSFYKINCSFGGDYHTFATKTEFCFSSLKECNINPVVVMDGGLDKSDRTFPTQMERWRDRINRVQNASATGISTHPFLPHNAIEDFKCILLNLGVSFIQCEYDSDAQTAALANHFNCPVLSDDGDFFIFDVKNGYIRLSSFDNFLVLTTEDKRIKYLKCTIYHLNTFLTYHTYVDKNVLPLLASIAGNDYIKFFDLKLISRNVYPVPGQKMPQILKWLRNRKYSEAVEQLLRYIHTEKREEFRLLLDHSVSSYRVDNRDLSYLFDRKCSQLIISHSQLVTPCGMAFPNEYILNHTSGCLPPYFLNMINLHRLFHSPQVGDLTDHSSSKYSRFVCQVIYGVLFQHETANIEYHNLVCLRDVDEYDTCKGLEVCFKVKPLFVLPSGKCVPKLHEIKLLNKTARMEVLAEVMGIKKSYLRDIPSSLRLLFGCINYWLLHCSPKPTKEFIDALLLCIIQFSVLDKPILKPSLKEHNYDDSLLIYSLLDRITPNESCFAFTNLEKYSSQYVFNGRFDASIIQSYNQLQSCLKYLISLNKLLASPLKSPIVSEIFEGTMLYNLTKKLISVTESKIFIMALLGSETRCYRIFSILQKKVLKNIPTNFSWKQIYSKNMKSSFQNYITKLDLKNAVSVSNKFECLNVSEE